MNSLSQIQSCQRRPAARSHRNGFTVHFRLSLHHRLKAASSMMNMFIFIFFQWRLSKGN